MPNISKYADFQLQPHVKKLNLFFQNTADIVKTLNTIKSISSDKMFVSPDVQIFFTNTVNNDSEAVRECTTKQSTIKNKNPRNNNISDTCCKISNLKFNCKNCLKIKGWQMGTKCAQAYANIFMGKFEEQHTFQWIKDKSILYLKKTIKFEMQLSSKGTVFLDTLAYKKVKLCKEKPTGNHQIDQHTFKNIRAHTFSERIAYRMKKSCF